MSTLQFNGMRARELRRRLEECKRNPDYARALFSLPPLRKRKR